MIIDNQGKVKNSYSQLNNKINLVIVTPFRQPGGISVVTKGLIKNLSKDEYHLNVVDTNHPSIKKIPIIGKFLHGIFQPISILIRVLFALPKACLIQVQASSWWGFMPVIISVLAIHIIKKPILVFFYGGQGDLFVDRHGWWIKRVLSYVDQMVVSTEFTKLVFERIGIHSDIIPVSVDTDEFRFTERTFHRHRLLWVRHFEPLYNPQMAIEAFMMIQKRVPGVTLTIIGGGTLEEYIRKYIYDHNIYSINIRGRVSFEDLIIAYEDADIFLNTSRVDNFPLTLLEAGSTGLALISTNVGGIPYVFTSNLNCLLVESESPSDMANAAVKLLNSPKQARYLGRNAHLLAKMYSWENTISEYSKLYRKDYRIS